DREPERDGADHKATRRAFEDATAVVEAALLPGHGPSGGGVPVVDVDGDDGVGNLLAVGTHVLDGNRSNAAGDAGQRLDAGPTAVDGEGDQSVPVLPRLRGHDHRRVVVVGAYVEATGGDPDHSRRDALVGHHEIAPAAQDEAWI